PPGRRIADGEARRPDWTDVDRDPRGGRPHRRHPDRLDRLFALRRGTHRAPHDRSAARYPDLPTLPRVSSAARRRRREAPGPRRPKREPRQAHDRWSDLAPPRVWRRGGASSGKVARADALSQTRVLLRGPSREARLGRFSFRHAASRVIDADLALDPGARARGPYRAFVRSRAQRPDG